MPPCWCPPSLVGLYLPIVLPYLPLSCMVTCVRRHLEGFFKCGTNIHSDWIDQILLIKSKGSKKNFHTHSITITIPSLSFAQSLYCGLLQKQAFPPSPSYIVGRKQRTDTWGRGRGESGPSISGWVQPLLLLCSAAGHRWVITSAINMWSSLTRSAITYERLALEHHTGITKPTALKMKTIFSQSLPLSLGSSKVRRPHLQRAVVQALHPYPLVTC